MFIGYATFVGYTMFYVYLILLTIIFLGVYLKSTYAICESNKRLDGKTAIVTGGTAGIGLQIATDFAKRGARVIIACPFEKEGIEARKNIVNKTRNEEVIFKLLDLSSIKSVRKFADEIAIGEEKLNILVNNAGVFMAKEYITEDGMSSTMQINYFGPFLLTLLLMPLLKRTGRISEPSRIVNATSQAHFKGKIDFEKINDIKHWTPFQIYTNSKLCLILFTRELTKKMEASNVVVNSADPGFVPTGILKFNNIIIQITYYHFVRVFSSVVFKSPHLGAQSAIHAALDDNAGLVSGEMFYNCKLSRAAAIAYDEDLMRKLWDESIKLVKLNSEEIVNI